MIFHCHPPLTSPPPALLICHSLTPRETCGDEMLSILLWSWCHSQALMCKTKLALFFEKLQVSIPSSKVGRQAPSQFSHFCYFLNFTQFSKDSTLAKFLQHPFLLPPLVALFLFVFPNYLFHANASWGVILNLWIYELLVWGLLGSWKLYG